MNFEAAHGLESRHRFGETGEPIRRFSWSARDRIRSEVAARDPLVCVYCGQRLHAEGKVGGERYFTVDHIQPLSQGGPDEAENCVVACRRCNGSRGSEPFLIFMARQAPAAPKGGARG